MPSYISTLIVVITSFMVFQSILFIAYNKYKTDDRIATRTSHSSHITPILKSLRWLLVKYNINFKICCKTHRALSLGELHYLNK